MMPITNKYVLDASALLALINEEEGHKFVAEILSQSMMSTVNVSEVAAVLRLINMPQKDIQDIIRNLIPTFIPFDLEQAYIAAELRALTKPKGLSFGDRACLALAKKKKIIAATADKAWKGISPEIDVYLIR